ncbi:unnamed protein product, partial [Prorocentrum cordatum]
EKRGLSWQGREFDAPAPDWFPPFGAVAAQTPWRPVRRQRPTLWALASASCPAAVTGVGWQAPPHGYEREKWYYVGNTLPVPRLGIPSLNLMDASAGFSLNWHELVGTVTAWPSMLSLAATWDREVARIYAMALGNEFGGKGANGILGPQLNVIRPARGGRNMESLSGEDPYLGARLAEMYVHGVQSQGVLATMKHWIFNEQETERDKYSVEVDDTTAWELYYPPFEAAVNAGVCATMCSYNKVDGVYSCENSKQLVQVLKGTMGFRGYVQSDWWATHSTSLAEGLDQQMPGNANPVDYFSKDSLSNQSSSDVDEAAKRVLAAIYRLNLTSPCSQGKCKKWFHKNVTSSAHAGLARAVAAMSIVLLKNEDDILPLQADRLPRKTVALVGRVAAAGPYDPSNSAQQEGDWHTGDYYTAGGSGHVTAGRVTTPLQGITARAAQMGVKVLTPANSSNSAQAAISVAEKADVTLIFAGTTAGESVDRDGLGLDDGMDALIKEVSAHAQRTVVLLEIPGSVLMPWREDVSGIAAMFLGGQEAGAAWADVLFGDRAPEGRLPVSIPAREEDTVPITGGTIAYSEGLATGYRNLEAVPAFAFGHGLTYTHFDFLPPGQVNCSALPEEEEGPPAQGGAVVCVEVEVRNAGWRPARAVPQLYLEMARAEANAVAPVLRGFWKTGLLDPGRSEVARFRLTQRDLSYYSAEIGAWVVAAAADAHIGASSADVRQTLRLELPRSAAAQVDSFDREWWNDLLGAAALLGLAGGAACCHAAMGRPEGRPRSSVGVAWLHGDSDT